MDIKCPNCANINNTNSRFCTYCGQPFQISLKDIYQDNGRETQRSDDLRPALFVEALDNYSKLNLNAVKRDLLELLLKVPNQPEYHNLLGCVLLKEEKLNLARLHFEKAIKSNVSLWEAHYNLGIVYVLQKRNVEARKIFKTVITLNKEHYQSYYNIGTLLLKEGCYKEAINYFLAVKKLMPGYKNNSLNLKIALKKFKEAVER